MSHLVIFVYEDKRFLGVCLILCVHIKVFTNQAEINSLPFHFSTIKIEDQVMMTEGHSFCCSDCDLLSTRMIHYIVFNLLF